MYRTSKARKVHPEVEERVVREEEKEVLIRDVNGEIIYANPEDVLRESRIPRDSRLAYWNHVNNPCGTQLQAEIERETICYYVLSELARKNPCSIHAKLWNLYERN